MKSVESEIALLKERNARVDIDKAWETSVTRRACIAGITYLCACLFLFQLGADDFALGALVPVGGYALSTLSLPRIKMMWLKGRRRSQANGDS